jgi:hypothetical protein
MKATNNFRLSKDTMYYEQLYVTKKGKHCWKYTESGSKEQHEYILDSKQFTGRMFTDRGLVFMNGCIESVN